MEKMITDIELLPEATQEAIKRDIENRILKKARTVFEDTPEKFSKYIENEIENAVKCKNEMIDESQRKGLNISEIHNISVVYVFNKERIAALKRLRTNLLKETKQDIGFSLPDEILTNNADAKTYFERALKCGYIKKTPNGFKWQFGGNKGQARLGYFCLKIFNHPRPISPLEKLFEVRKLSSSITNAEIPPKRDDVKRWRKEIDTKIFF